MSTAPHNETTAAVLASFINDVRIMVLYSRSCHGETMTENLKSGNIVTMKGLVFVFLFFGSQLANAMRLSRLRMPKAEFNAGDLHGNRRSLLTFAATLVTAPLAARSDIGQIMSASIKNSEISYSSNARNIARLSANDSSGGSKYDLTSPASAKRRAMTGCKFSNARILAGEPDEKKCNARVISGDIDFMLDALKSLDCPECAFGISTK